MQRECQVQGCKECKFTYCSCKESEYSECSERKYSQDEAIVETATTSPIADTANDAHISNESKDSNESSHSAASNIPESSCEFSASDVTSSFDRLKVIYKKIGDNESQAFGVWQQLSESERTAAFAHSQRLQGDLSLRSYLYVYLRDMEWMKAM